MRIRFVALLILCCLISGCSVEKQSEDSTHSILYDFQEPTSFPFEVNDVRTEIAIDNVDTLHQFVFHYKNKQTTQEIKYVLSKVIDESETASYVKGMKPLEVINGKQTYYEEDDSSQSIWWENEKGFVARYVYYINGSQEPLGMNTLTESELIELVKQVQ
ncbi:hypothetical protein [Paenibacillus lupini]|uniref:hypothetical protein n=1 Tax=Paenibacillus lupini TaxID=1450204 RepID=UPI0014245472|nr:hypothetical protein [Paenibacillus lupini]NIK22437.1 hypothetical protein [Paenibacillus lupini]